MTHGRRLSVLLLPLAAGLTGCGKLFSITIEESSTTVIASGGLLSELTGQLGFDDFLAMDITDNQELANQGVEPGDIQDVEVTLIELTATDPAGADLSFIESIDVYVTSPDLPEVLIATQDAFPDGQASVALELERVDLTDYAVAESMTITTDASGTMPEDDTTVRADIEMRVGVTGRGATRKRN